MNDKTEYFVQLLNDHNTSLNEMIDFIYSSTKKYNIIRIVKNGKLRVIYNANEDLKKFQKIILLFLQEFPVHNVAHGWVKDRSTVTATSPHCRKKFVGKIDISDFYPSISFRMLSIYFLRWGIHKDIVFPLCKCLTARNCLAQGYLTSSIMANLLFYTTDHRIASLCKKNKVEYTRYGDDLIFSSHYDLSSIINLSQKIINQNGFKINDDKTMITKENESQTALNHTLNKKINVLRKNRKVLRALCNNCLNDGLEKHIPLGEDADKFISKIKGRLNYYSSVNPETTRSSINKFDEAVRLYRMNKDL